MMVGLTNDERRLIYNLRRAYGETLGFRKNYEIVFELIIYV